MNFGQRVIFSVIYCVGLYVTVNKVGELVIAGTDKVIKTLKERSDKKVEA